MILHVSDTVLHISDTILHFIDKAGRQSIIFPFSMIPETGKSTLAYLQEVAWMTLRQSATRLSLYLARQVDLPNERVESLRFGLEIIIGSLMGGPGEDFWEEAGRYLAAHYDLEHTIVVINGDRLFEPAKRASSFLSADTVTGDNAPVQHTACKMTFTAESS
jgi:hypothetical protein